MLAYFEPSLFLPCQVIWRQTTAVGCAIEKSRADDASPYTVFVVCHYYPASLADGEVGAFISDYSEFMDILLLNFKAVNETRAILRCGEVYN